MLRPPPPQRDERRADQHAEHDEQSGARSRRRTRRRRRARPDLARQVALLERCVAGGVTADAVGAFERRALRGRVAGPALRNGAGGRRAGRGPRTRCGFGRRRGRRRGRGLGLGGCTGCRGVDHGTARGHPLPTDTIGRVSKLAAQRSVTQAVAVIRSVCVWSRRTETGLGTVLTTASAAARVRHVGQRQARRQCHRHDETSPDQCQPHVGRVSHRRRRVNDQTRCPAGPVCADIVVVPSQRIFLPLTLRPAVSLEQLRQLTPETKKAHNPLRL